jgi:hypothetical protein
MANESINPKDAIGRLKPSIADIPGTALVEMSIVHRLGHTKYGYYNWRTVPKVQAMVYANAAMRHLVSWIDGETIDPESLRTHLAHVIACCNILIDSAAVGNLDDDRPAKAPTAELIRSLTEVPSANSPHECCKDKRTSIGPFESPRLDHGGKV